MADASCMFIFFGFFGTWDGFGFTLRGAGVGCPLAIGKMTLAAKKTDHFCLGAAPRNS